MSDITVTAANVAAIRPLDPGTIIVPVILAETATAGQLAYLASSGKYGLADANGSGKQQFRGVFLTGGAAGQVADMLIRGYVAGYTVSGLAYDALVYLSDTAGAFADAAGTMTVRCGRVVPLTDNSLTKVLWIDATPGYITAWS